MRHLSAACLSLLLSLPAAAADSVDYATINRIIDEGFNHSELPQTAEYLTDRIGGRLTNSPQMRAAEKWTQERYQAWGLANIHKEGFDFGRGWSIESFSVRLIAPRALTLRAIPVAWTPSTAGTLSADIVVAPMRRERDFDKWKGQLRGKVVLISKPDEGSRPDKPAFTRLSAEDLAKLEAFEPPRHSQVKRARELKDAEFERRLDAFLAAEGALAWLSQSYRDGGLVSGEGYSYEAGRSPVLPGFQVAAEDYRRLARLAKAGAAPRVELNSVVHYHDEDHQAYNVLAEIPGRDKKAGYVMAGAHLDSWVAADGAADNGAGSVAVMEAARILAKLKVKPRRTIRFALWSAEEQAIGGSMAYVERHFATRPPPKGADKDINPYYTFNTRWPITPLPGHGEIAAYFNLDNGSGKVRGIYAEGNPAVVPIFREWLEPFASMGATQVSAQRTGGTDHVFMQQVGIPGFQFIQDPLDYDTRIHHSSLDSYDHLQMDDLKQSAVILASMLWMAAERDQALPRPPVPSQPADSDPFSHEDIDDEDAGTD